MIPLFRQLTDIHQFQLDKALSLREQAQKKLEQAIDDHQKAQERRVELEQQLLACYQGGGFFLAHAAGMLDQIATSQRLVQQRAIRRMECLAEKQQLDQEVAMLFRKKSTMASAVQREQTLELLLRQQKSERALEDILAMRAAKG